MDKVHIVRKADGAVLRQSRIGRGAFVTDFSVAGEPVVFSPEVAGMMVMRCPAPEDYEVKPVGGKHGKS